MIQIVYIIERRGEALEKLTIKDVARLVGVSTATVSNYLNSNYSKMSKQTRQRLQDMIEQTNYQPSNVARGLAKNENKTIGVSVADITNPFTSIVLSGIYDTCGRSGYSVVFTNASGDSKREVININKLRQEEVSGLIIDPVDAESPIYKLLSNDTTVMIDRQAAIPKIDTIVTNNFESVSNFVNQMIEENYEELFFVSWPLENVSTRQKRYQGFLNATHYQDDEHLIYVENKGGEKAFQEKLSNIMNKFSNKKIGFFSMNGRVLIRLLHAMQELGFYYPGNFGIGTYEDLDWMEIMKPGISCIQQDSFEIGVRSVNILAKKLKSSVDSEQKPRIIFVPTKINIRGSY